VLVVPHHHDATRHLALAVELGDAAAHLRSESDVGNHADQDGGAPFAGAQREAADVVEGLDVTASADDVLLPGELDRAAAHVPVAGTNHLHDPGEGDVVGG